MKKIIGTAFFVALMIGVMAFSASGLYAQACPAVPGTHAVVWALDMPSGEPPEALTSVEWSVENVSESTFSCTLSNHSYVAGSGIFTINVQSNVCTECSGAEAFDCENGDILTVTVTGTRSGESPATSTFSVVLDLDNSPQFEGDLTLPVELSAFEAIGGDGVVLLKWATESEIDNQGFHVYRSASEKGEYTRITNQMIKGAGTSTSRQDYQYEDRSVENGQTYYYKLEDVDFAGNRRNHGPVSATPDNGKVIQGLVPDKFALDQNYPNPFNPETTISYDLPEGTFVTLDIYNLMGQKIRTLVNEEKPAGSYPVKWNGLDDNGRPVATGLYVYTIKAGSFSQTKKMLFLK